ncbi:hypothetical protein L6452_03436 [Arctium lappa]|uniref:Uncharacterized protein n=1 Tax=Arctium lappa TaxID=4217 RepID=A0ACB9FLP0_ARCLA|nr:hypothetical protein L6452_03436 [Arctium lappa]
MFFKKSLISDCTMTTSKIDVPNELLLEWWVVNSDFSEWERKNSLDNEGSSYKAEGSIWQQSGLTLSREYALNEEMIEELTLDNSFGVVFGKKLLPETVSNLGSMIQFSGPTDQDCTDNQGIESVVQAFQRTTLIASNEVSLAVPNPGISLPSFPLVNQGGTDDHRLDSIVEAFVRSRNASNENIAAAGLMPNCLMPNCLMLFDGQSKRWFIPPIALELNLLQVAWMELRQPMRLLVMVVGIVKACLDSELHTYSLATHLHSKSCIADGSITSGAGKRFVLLSDQLTLHSVLHSQNGRKRKRSRDYEDGSIDIPGTNISHLETSSRSRDSDHLFEFPSSLIKIAEDWMRDFGEDDDFNLPPYLFEEKNDEEGNFCSKGITFKLSSSLVEERQEDTSFIKDDTFELSSLVKGKINEEGDSSSRDAYTYDSSSHDKGNEDDGALSAINLDELHKAPNNDETQGVTVGGSFLLQPVLHSKSLTWSSEPANLDDTYTLGSHSAAQAILRTTEIASTEDTR